ncbi:CLUMA_CG018446, isoform A [Clunio marinus]|uniref:CLUMA_CG018446, isoform A n=1 Tax=Clunio marinus TaxID=568069 RepID=A0A1J1J031_9DIPT|nr:CLUMA_CG018446, isoform A [Clunio marinus]
MIIHELQTYKLNITASISDDEITKIFRRRKLFVTIFKILVVNLRNSVKKIFQTSTTLHVSMTN